MTLNFNEFLQNMRKWFLLQPTEMHGSTIQSLKEIRNFKSFNQIFGLWVFNVFSTENLSFKEMDFRDPIF